MQCIICQNKAEAFAKRIEEGAICADCFSHIPTMVDHKSCSVSKLWVLIQKNKEKQRRFMPTASLGTLYIDSVHKMFCISEKEKNGDPVSLSDIYDISELNEVGLYCKDAKNIGKGNNPSIVCDVELYVRTDEMCFRTIILKNEPCSYKLKDKQKVEWNEPGVLVMFRGMWNQMLDDRAIDFMREVEKAHNNKNIIWAEGVLMLGTDYTYEEVCQHRDILRTALASQDAVFLQKIDMAYNILCTKIAEEKLKMYEKDKKRIAE